MSDNKEYTLDDLNNGKTLYEFVQEQLKDLDTDDLSDEVSDEIITDITPEVVYFWTRLYLKEENPNVEIGDWVNITYTPSGEKLKCQFFAYGKTGLERDHDDELINFNSEDDKKVLCLMVEEKIVNESEDIQFIRTLFKLGRHYEYQLVKRDELQFVVERNGVLLDYFDSDF
jgi:hypothetical protein